MKLIIRHETEYTFSKDVFIEPHCLRFFPRPSPYLHVSSYQLEVLPTPAGVSWSRDIEGNLAQLCWFDGLHRRLHLLAETQVDITSRNQFDFILHPGDNAGIPVSYSPAERRLLVPHRATDPVGSDVLAYVNEMAASSNHRTLPFLSNLTRAIANDFTLETRKKAPPRPPDQAFAHRRGPCRDLAWMQVQMLRHLGFAARFCSGYYYLESDRPTWELHAWTEVYLPGPGWVGYDPSHGIACTDQHIPVAASATPTLTYPVNGTYRGEHSAQLRTRLQIKRS